MKKIPVYLVIFTISLFLSIPAYSQGGFSIHGGTAIPLGDFGDDDYNNENGSGAGIGFNIGGKYQYQLNEGGLGLYLSGNVNYNGLKKNIRDDIKSSFEDLGASLDITYYKHLNIPLTAGLYYEFEANESVSLFGELGLGVDFLKITSMKLEANGQEASFNFKTKPQLAFEFGGGLLIKGKYIVDLRYCGLGKHNSSGEFEFDGSTEDLGDTDLKVSLLTVSLGFKF